MKCARAAVLTGSSEGGRLHRGKGAFGLDTVGVVDVFTYRRRSDAESRRLPAGPASLDPPAAAATTAAAAAGRTAVEVRRVVAASARARPVAQDAPEAVADRATTSCPGPPQ